MFSAKVNPSTYETEGLCEGIDVRQTSHTQLEWLGAIQAHEDWSSHVSPIKHYRGALGPKFSFVGVTLPECIPQRLEVLCYACEFAVLHDDVADTADNHTISAYENDKVIGAYHEILQDGGPSISGSVREAQWAGGKKQIQAQIVRRMLAIDQGATRVTLCAWAQFLTAGSGRQHQSFETLDIYLPYRVKDIGEMFWFGVVTFGLGLSIPDSEMALLSELTRPAWISVGLTNDLYSWDKEAASAAASGKDYVVNAIWVLMHEHSISAADAKAKCRELIKEYVAEFLENVSRAKADPSVSPDFQSYIEAMQYKISGNVVWSLTCPRYNLRVCYNEQQRRWMNDGISADELAFHRNSLEQEPGGLSSGSSTTAALLSAKGSQKSSQCGLSEQSLLSFSTNPPSSIGDRTPADPFSDLFNDATSAALSRQLPPLDAQIASAPVDYLSTLPSKGLRSLLIDALNCWLQAAPQVVGQIKVVVDLLHNSSLLLDDIQDGSTLRRGLPAAHTIFGPAQSINSSSRSIVRALLLIEQSLGPDTVRSSLASLDALFIGQSYDLYFTHVDHCPSVEEYMRTIDQKTGGLFCLSSELLQAGATENSTVDLRHLCVLFGRYFQIRDDYQNLNSAHYADQKGFCEDLDEGKYSLPMIHMMMSLPDSKKFLVQNIRAVARTGAVLTKHHKLMILDRLKEAGSFDFTLRVLDRLAQAIKEEITTLEASFGKKNAMLRALWTQVKLGA